MLSDAAHGKYDVVMAFALDRIGRSLADLLHTIRHLEECKVDLFIDKQMLDTTTPQGRLLFAVTGAFAEFERDMIVSRVNARLACARARGVQLGARASGRSSPPSTGRSPRATRASTRLPLNWALAPVPWRGSNRRWRLADHQNSCRPITRRLQALARPQKPFDLRLAPTAFRERDRALRSNTGKRRGIGSAAAQR
jgi:hypothetical protein